MPLGDKVKCSKCNVNESLMWHQYENGIKCNDCVEKEREQLVTKDPDEAEQKSQPEKNIATTKSPVGKKSPKITRSYKTRQNPNATPKQIALKGKGRRTKLRKTSPVKLQPTRATITTSNSVVFRGQLLEVGDIVSINGLNNKTYYAQIKGLMTDEYCEKSASLAWLLPTKSDLPFPKQGFDPMTFVLGPDDDLPRKLEYLTFVMKAPSDYFRQTSPFPTGLPFPNDMKGYIWGRLGK